MQAANQITEQTDKERALIQHLEAETGDKGEQVIFEIAELVDGSYQTDHGDFLVLTDSEAEDELEAQLDSILEEVVLPEVPENLRNYIDEEAWKRDARFDGRGHYLSPYDGVEHEQQVGDQWFYIYRV